MSTIAEIAAMVVDTTKRPDKAAFILGRVKAAILHIHSLKDFPLDIREVQEVPTILTTGDTIGQASMPLRFRKFELVRALDAKSNPFPQQKFKIVTPRALMEMEERSSVVDTAYIAGGNFNFRSSRPVTNLLMYYYAAPDLTDTTKTTWVTDTWDIAVHDLACGYFYSQTSAKEIANSYLGVFESIHKQDIENSYVDAARGLT